MPDYSLECLNCGETNPATARFCGSCQTQLPENPQPAPVAGAQSAHLAGSQPTSISPAKTSTKKQKIWGWVAIAWGMLLLLIGVTEMSEGDIDFGLVCLVGAAPLYGGINMIGNKKLFGIHPGIIAIALVVLSLFIFGSATGLDDISPT